MKMYLLLLLRRLDIVTLLTITRLFPGRFVSTLLHSTKARSIVSILLKSILNGSDRFNQHSEMMSKSSKMPIVPIRIWIQGLQPKDPLSTPSRSECTKPLGSSPRTGAPKSSHKSIYRILTRAPLGQIKRHIDAYHLLTNKEWDLQQIGVVTCFIPNYYSNKKVTTSSCSRLIKATTRKKIAKFQMV